MRWIKQSLIAVQHLAALQGVGMEDGGGMETPSGRSEKCSSQGSVHFAHKFCAHSGSWWCLVHLHVCFTTHTNTILARRHFTHCAASARPYSQSRESRADCVPGNGNMELLVIINLYLLSVFSSTKYRCWYGIAVITHGGA